PAANAIEKIFAMIVAVIEADGVVNQWFFPKRCRSGFKLPAVHEDLPFRANEEDAAAVAVKHFDPIGINVAEAFSCLGVLGWNDFDWAALVHAESPLRNVEMVGAPISHHATGV